MIEICHVQLLPLLSGVQRAMLEILRHLDRQRYRPHVVCQGPGPLSAELERLDIPCHFVPSLVRPIRPWSDLAAYHALVDLFRHFRFDLVHTHSSKPGVLGRLAARRAGVPLVVHHNHSFPFHAYTPAPLRALYRFAERVASPCCDRVIFVSHEDRERSAREGFVPAHKCLTIHNGIDLAPYSHEEHERRRQEFRRQHSLADDEMAIIFCGRIDRQKQPLILPEIVRTLEKLRPGAKWRLFVAGNGGMESRLKAAVRKLPDPRRVVLLGWQTEVHRVYHGCDVCLLPSLWEGLPLSAIEAHAAGLPVVGSDVTGIREVVTTATGMLCPPQNAAAFAASLAALVDDPFQRRRMGLVARKRAFDHFNGDCNMRQVADLYDQWLGTDRPQLRQAG